MVNFEQTAGGVREYGLPDMAPLYSETTDLETLKSQDGYRAAKEGDILAAANLVRGFVTAETAMKVGEAFRGALFLPVLSGNVEGHRNALPLAAAVHYSVVAGGAVALGVVQVNRACHAGARAMERMLVRAQFEGEIKRGARYVLVDDVSTMGGTLADLASFVQANGGVVIGSVLLANCSRHGIVNGNDKKAHKILGAKYDQDIRQLFGISPNALTRDEARYLVGFKSADEMRNRADAARAERAVRLAAKELLSGSESCLNEAPAFC